jgi:O-acetyl-ADP-ribose deacetylase (regulator of RNase III)
MESYNKEMGKEFLRGKQMITIVSHGDIITCGAQVLVCPVNCEGIVKGGLALEFRKAFPANFSEYRNLCWNGYLRKGSGTLTYPPRKGSRILNFPTKQNYGEKSSLDWIEEGMACVSRLFSYYRWQSIAIPPLGCGFSGLTWEIVKELIKNRSHMINVKNIFLFEPSCWE